MVTELNEQRLKRADELAHAGRFSKAVEEYRALAQSIEDPMYKAGMLLNEIMCLRELGEIDLAKRRLRQIKASVPDVSRYRDSAGDDPEPCLAVEMQFEEIGLYLAEGREKKGLAKLEDLFARYPKHIRRPEHHSLYELAQTRRAFLLANFGRCAEARPILEEACSFEKEKSSIYYYLGHCYCTLGEFELARQKLTEALSLGLPGDSGYRAHHALGIAYYKLGAYARAKQEFEVCAQKADHAYLRETWKWLENTCRHLGLDDEADHYAKLSWTG